MNQKESFVIEGLAEERSLSGTVKVHGAKNAALKAMAASVLFAGPVELRNVPRNNDIETLSKILIRLGAKVAWQDDGALSIDTSAMSSTDIDAELAGSMRASVVLTGPLLARFGKVTFPAPGGCVIGARPIDLFLAGYEKMGATVTLDAGACVYRIESAKKLSGAEMFFNKVTVGGTETLMMTAVLASGKTVLKNCAMEPEIANVAEWLVSCGARIEGIGTPTMAIHGSGGALLQPRESYEAIPDRIEAGSFLILGALCASRLAIEGCRPDHLDAVIGVLRGSGAKIETAASRIVVEGSAGPEAYAAIADLRTHEYPGFPTDLQPVIVAYLTQASGESRIFETIYEGRFKYIEDLQKLGASITVMNPREISVKGATPLRAMAGDGDLTAHDIRAGFAVVMAALCGSGTFTVSNVHLIDRGYERLEQQLAALGASVQRIKAA